MYIYIYIFITTSLRPHCNLTGIMVNNRNYPNVVLFQLSELLSFAQTFFWGDSMPQYATVISHPRYENQLLQVMVLVQHFFNFILPWDALGHVNVISLTSSCPAVEPKKMPPNSGNHDQIHRFSAHVPFKSGTFVMHCSTHYLYIYILIYS